MSDTTSDSSTVEPNQSQVASDNAAVFIASFEAMGFICPDGRVRAYQDGGCAKGNWTIGIGEMSGRDQDSVFDSEADAYASFVNKVKSDYTNRVRAALKRQGVTRELAQYEFDALVDLAYQKGNCQALAQLIASGKTLIASDFTSQTDGFADRRLAEFNLFSGHAVTVSGYTKYLRLDNSNGGYCSIGGQKGFERVPSTERHALNYESQSAST